jgi:hypothetical protein
MKLSVYLSAFFLTLIFGSCKKSDTTPTPTTPTTFSLTVNNGEGSGTYKIGDTAYIFSNPATTSQVFDKWTGDISALTSPNEWITATFKTTAPINFTNVVINGSQVFYFVPATYRGIIIPFHGAGGSAVGWTTSKGIDNLEFLRYAAANGYAIVVTESKDRVNKRWETSTGAASVDISNIDAIISSLQTSGIIASGKPFYGVGMSQGSGFLSLISTVKNYKAAALYCLGGVDQIYDNTTVPTIWNMAKLDITEDPNRLITASANYQKLQTRTIPSAYYVNEPSPIFPNRFTIIPGIDANGSAAIYNSLKSAGYINAKGYFTIDPRVSSVWFSAVPSQYNNSTMLPMIDDQIYISYTQHKFYKDSDFRTIEFFNRF